MLQLNETGPYFSILYLTYKLYTQSNPVPPEQTILGQYYIIQYKLQNYPNNKMNNSNRIDVFENYSQFLIPNNQSLQQINHSLIGAAQDQFADDMCTPSDIDKILKQKFFKAEYPTDLTSLNIFCPICGRIVKSQQPNSMYSSISYKRRFLAHDVCLSQQSTRLLNDYFDQVEQMNLIQNHEHIQKMSVSISERQFCLQLCLTHPLSDYKFLKLISRCYLSGNSLKWSFRQQQQVLSYSPNMICFPYIDFNVSLLVSQINSNEEKKKISNYVNLSKVKLSSTKSIKAIYEQMTLQFNVYNSQEQKNQMINMMNYKYQFSQKLNLPIVQLTSLQIQIPQDQYDDQLYNNNSSVAIVEQLLSQKNQQSSYASSMYLYSNQKKYPHYNQSSSLNGAHQQKSLNSSVTKSNQKLVTYEKQKVDFLKLVSTGKLSSYVRNSTQSRIFQNFLDQATPQQIQIIIKHLYDEFPQLVVDQYANYMAQKLFQVCSNTQRIFILQKLSTQLPNLVKNKQGTHTIQFFTSLFTSQQQFMLIVESVRKQFEQLCYHSISTHFIQKIIKIFPLATTLNFYFIANNNFVKFATDKNAMCVLKYMLRRINQSDQNQRILQIKKHFINSITLNTDKIIQDCYGNYVVQFCYELFGQQKSSGITQRIIQKFVQFSLQKYSSSVVSKCINGYWTDKSFIDRLKDQIKSQGILQMYRNRQGNKILLDLLDITDKIQNTWLRQKICNILSKNREPSKYYHQRWGMQIGIRSGPVGIEFKSFTQADNLQRNIQNSTGKKSKKK